jgi:hypothetical protein
MKKTEFEKARSLAMRKGWRTPPFLPCGEKTWINYWNQCAEYERDPEAGRPVVPHR